MIFPEHFRRDTGGLHIAMRFHMVAERHFARMFHQQGVFRAVNQADTANAISPFHEIRAAKAILERLGFQDLDDIELAADARYLE